MKIAAIGGSLRSGSYTYQILDLSLRKIEARGVSVELIDLRKLKLPFCDGGVDYPDYPDFEKLKQAVQSSQGLLISTPEYHGSVSGVLKNALDLLDEEDLRGKVVGLISVMGGTSSTNAVNTLRLICRHMHAWVIPEQVVIPYAADSFDRLGKLTDPIIDQRLTGMIESLLDTCRKLSAE